MRYIKKILLTLIKSKISLSVILSINYFIRKIASITHYCQYVSEWYGCNTAEWFDHNIDQYCLWHKFQNPMGNERGIFNLLFIKQNANILELCCGDGFNAYYFYASKAKSIDCIDIDKNAISRAIKNYKSCGKANINFIVGNICYDIPQKQYHNIIWDAAIEHFTIEGATTIINSLKRRLLENGILSGYTIVEKNDGRKSLEEHKHEYSSKTELFEFLNKFFKHVIVFETIYVERHNLYFFASDNQLPINNNIISTEIGLHQQL
jgi:ubiquinone/menaquinone biosynthesis C-methylase UbiE